MKKVAEFLTYAQRCERLAEVMPDCGERNKLNETASQWRDMAAQRELLLQFSVYRMVCSGLDLRLPKT
jgi:hypothetical protein